MSQEKIYLQWNNDTLVWGTSEYIWSEVYIIIQIAEAVGGGGGMLLPKKGAWNDLEKMLDDKKISTEQKKIFLQVIARVNGLTTSRVKSVSSLKKKITVDHIKNTFNAFGQKVEVKIKNVKKQ
jgi:hypothetical protein